MQRIGRSTPRARSSRRWPARLGHRTRYFHLPRWWPMAFAADRALAALGLYWQTLHLVGESDWHVGVSCDKACRQLGYQPAMTLADGCCVRPWPGASEQRPSPGEAA